MPRKKTVKPTKQSAGSRIAAQGKTLIWVTPDASQKKKIRLAAAIAGKPMSQFLLDCGLTAADELLKKTSLTG